MSALYLYIVIIEKYPNIADTIETIIPPIHKAIVAAPTLFIK
ncbi:uncharacterized protein METZ01_LOCUS270371 [marine metagenome]|uniref:Uncharacterized protein n=1 Tax=marine metagenome TaxID=408172 RepID=A0A382K372_9ZZZZ